MEDEEWKARRIEIEKQAAEARALKKRKRAENEAKNRAEVGLPPHLVRNPPPNSLTDPPQYLAELSTWQSSISTP